MNVAGIELHHIRRNRITPVNQLFRLIDKRMHACTLISCQAHLSPCATSLDAAAVWLPHRRSPQAASCSPSGIHSVVPASLIICWR